LDGVPGKPCTSGCEANWYERQVKYVELITYTPYSSDNLLLETVYSPESVEPVTEAVARKEAGTLGIDYHLSASTDDIKKVFYALQERIMTLPGIEEMADQIVPR
jgi:hypothetical protein